MSNKNNANAEFKLEDPAVQYLIDQKAHLVLANLVHTEVGIFKALEYWDKKDKREPSDLVKIEIARLEALLMKRTDISMDVSGVRMSGLAKDYLDASTAIKPLKESAKQAEEVLGDGDSKKSKEEEGKTINLTTNQILGDKPPLKVLAAQCRELIKENKSDEAEKLAWGFLSKGNYVPNNEKKKAEPWNEKRFASWLRDVKGQAEETKHVKEETKKPSSHTDDKLTVAFQKIELGEDEIKLFGTTKETLESENDALDDFAEAYYNLIMEGTESVETADLLLHAFFDNRYYGKLKFSSKQIETWINWVTGDRNKENNKTQEHFEILRVPGVKDDSTGLTAFHLSYEQFVEEIVKVIKEGKLDKQGVINRFREKLKGKTLKNSNDISYNIWTPLNAIDLIERIYDANVSQESSEETSKPKTEDKSTDKKDETEDDIVKNSDLTEMFVATIKNGGVFEDEKGRSDILGNPKFTDLVGKSIEIINDKGESAHVVYKTIELLTPFLKDQFENAKANWEVKLKTYPLKQFLRIVETSFKSEISEEDVFKDNIDLVKKSDGTFLTLVKKEKNSSTKVNFESDQDVKDYIKGVYEIQRRLQTEEAATKVRENNDSKEEENTDEPDIKSINEIRTLGLKLINDLGYTFEKIVTWLMSKLLNKKLEEQDKAITSKDSITALAEGMFRREFGKDEKNVNLESEEFKAKVLEMEKSGKYKSTTLLINDLKNSFRDDGFDFDFSLLVKKVKSIILEANSSLSNKSSALEKDKEKTADTKEEDTDKTTEDNVEETDAENAEEETTEAKVEEEEDIKIQEKFSTSEPELWKKIQNFKSLEELQNMAIEFSEAGNWQKALSMCTEVIALGKIETAKNWTAEQTFDWFDKFVKRDETNQVEDVDHEEIKDSKFDFTEILNSPNKKHFGNSLIKLIKQHNDSADFRNDLLKALKSDLAKGKQTKRMKNLPPQDYHAMISRNVKIVKDTEKANG